MAIHTIRLRAPWKLKRQGERELWQRDFGCPSNLSEHETVRLVLQSESAEATVILNGRILGTAPAVYDITGALDQRNTLTLNIAALEKAARDQREPPFEVGLEIVS